MKDEKKAYIVAGVVDTCAGDAAMGSGIFRGELDDEQRAIFAQILDGKTGLDIAAVLGTTPTRVEAVIRKTCRQLDAPSRREAAQMISCHYGWKQIPPILSAQSNVRRDGGRYGAENEHFTTKMAQTEHEHRSRSGYVRDVGNQGLVKDDDAGAYNEVAGRISISKVLAASPTTQRVLLMALLIASSALALSALVAAMQGFDTLFFS
jgi:DNA-binding CsgD family transcriptional regulator